MAVQGRIDDKLKPGSPLDVGSVTIVVPDTEVRPDMRRDAISWTMYDNDDAVAGTGSVDRAAVSDAPGNYMVTFTANGVSVPTDVQPEPAGSPFYIVYTILVDGAKHSTTQEFTVYPSDAGYDPGIEDVVVLNDYRGEVKARIVTEGRNVAFDSNGAFNGDDSGRVCLILRGHDDVAIINADSVEPDSMAGGVSEYNIDIPVDNIWKFEHSGKTEVVVDPLFPGDPMKIPNAEGTTAADQRWCKPGHPECSEWTPYTKAEQLFISPSCDPYQLEWSYKDNRRLIAVSYVFVVNGVITQAARSLQQTLNRPLMRNGIGLERYGFTDADYIWFLQKGRDVFNSKPGITNFSMTGAEGNMMNYWLKCSIVEACESEIMVEAMKAFDFSGAGPSLTADQLRDAYDNLKSSAQSVIEGSDIELYKRELHRNGILNGPGGTKDTTIRRPIAIYGSPLGARWGSRAGTRWGFGGNVTRYIY